MIEPTTERLLAAKAQARRAGLAARDMVAAETRALLSARLVVEGMRLASRVEGAVSLFVALRSEPDLTPLADALRAAGRVTALPAMQGRGAPLAFRRWTPGEPLVPAAFGVREPSPDAPLITPALLFVPLAAFDRAGGRVGYGGGFYDRTLAALRAQSRVLAAGVCFAAQERDTIPRERTDEKLDMILTENETIEIC